MVNTNSPLPEKFLERLHELYPKDFESVLASFGKKSDPSFRVNTLLSNSTEVTKILTEDGFEIENVLWYPDAFILHNKSIRLLTETDAYKKGLIYIQSLSSMIPALVLNPQPGERVLDLAAAPGSKTSQIAARMNNTGEIIANDVSRKRMYKMHDILKQCGIINTKVSIQKGEFLWKRYPEVFDKTLIDVPCSMEGRMQSDDPKTYEDWSPKKIKQLSMLQKYLLRSAISATNVGGTIVYSTCTLSPEENEEVVEWAVEKTNNEHPNALTVEKIIIPNLPLDHGVTSWKKKKSNYTANTARITPGETMEGFFIAKIKKHSVTVPGMDIFH